jgi:hypothetical protein
MLEDVRVKEGGIVLRFLFKKGDAILQNQGLFIYLFIYYLLFIYLLFIYLLFIYLLFIYLLFIYLLNDKLNSYK